PKGDERTHNPKTDAGEQNEEGGEPGMTPQRRSMSTRCRRRSAHHWRSRGNVTLTRWSRSACLSRNVDEMKTRTVFQAVDMAVVRACGREPGNGESGVGGRGSLSTEY